MKVVQDVVEVEDIVVFDDEDAVVEDRPEVVEEDVSSVVMEVVIVVDNGGGTRDVVEMLELVLNIFDVVGRTVTDEIVESFLRLLSLLKFVLVSIDRLVLVLFEWDERPLFNVRKVNPMAPSAMIMPRTRIAIEADLFKTHEHRFFE